MGLVLPEKKTKWPCHLRVSMNKVQREPHYLRNEHNVDTSVDAGRLQIKSTFAASGLLPSVPSSTPRL
ncbi:unnamed protein product [Caretta caretta]